MLAEQIHKLCIALCRALVVLFFLPSVGLGKDERIVMVTEQWPPFRINDPSRPCGFSGIDIDLVKKISSVLDVEIQIQRRPWARALEMMRNGQADMISGVARTAERETFLLYVPISYYAVRPVFITQKAKGRLVRSYKDLYMYSVGYSLRSAYFEPFDSDSRLNKVGLSTEEQLLHVLTLGRIDLIIGTDPNISYDIVRLGYQDALEPTHYQPDVKTELYIALSRKTSAVIYAEKMKQVIKRFLTDGVIDAIVNAYR